MMGTVLKVFIESVTILFLFDILCFFDRETCGILVPQSVIKPPTSALGGDLNHCTSREVPKHLTCMCAAHAQVSWTEEKVRGLRQWLLKAASVEELYPGFFWEKKKESLRCSAAKIEKW